MSMKLVTSPMIKVSSNKFHLNDNGVQTMHIYDISFYFFFFNSIALNIVLVDIQNENIWRQSKRYLGTILSFLESNGWFIQQKKKAFFIY